MRATAWVRKKAACLHSKILPLQGALTIAGIASAKAANVEHVWDATIAEKLQKAKLVDSEQDAEQLN